MLSDELLLKVSELKSVYPDLEELLNRVEQEQNLFLSNISHELRNALTLMSSSLQYIEASHPEIQDYKYWKETKHDCRYMQSLVHNMSDFTNGTQLNCRRIDLNRLLREAYLACLPLTEHTEKSLTFTSSTPVPPLMADPTKLLEVFVNLIKNALESVQDDGFVRILCETDPRTVKIHIEDNGCGIEADKLVTIFQPFVTSKQGGTGLGLPVVKRIVEAHGGHITVCSAPGQGSVFTVSLPKSDDRRP